VSQIARDKDQLGPAREPVDGGDRIFKRPGAERIRRAVEPDVRVAQLNE